MHYPRRQVAAYQRVTHIQAIIINDYNRVKLVLCKYICKVCVLLDDDVLGVFSTCFIP